MERERRKFNRYIFYYDDFGLSTEELFIAPKIKDISQGGLSFQYYPKKGNKLANECINLKIIGKKRFNIELESCPIVYDIPSLEEGASFSGKTSRRCGIKFPKSISKKPLTIFFGKRAV